MEVLDNTRIADELERFAALLDLSGAGHYSVRAYRRAAELLRATPAPVTELVRTGRIGLTRAARAPRDKRAQQVLA